jgi:hypothetical protein
MKLRVDCFLGYVKILVQIKKTQKLVEKQVKGMNRQSRGEA